MRLRSMSLTAIVMAMVIVIAGCAKKVPPPPPQPPAPPPPAVAPPPPPPPPPRPLTEDEIFQRKTLEQLNAERPLGDVSFDYDMSSIKEDQRPVLQRNADYMRRWMSIKVTVEGHADARGTNEYNLALGERRAAAVRKSLGSFVMGEDRIRAIRKGKDQPLCGEMTEP